MLVCRLTKSSAILSREPSYGTFGLPETIARVESALRATAIESGSVCENHDSLVPPKALITNEWLQELRDQEGNQPKLLPVRRFVEVLPKNFMASAASGNIQDWSVKRIYTYPILQPGL